MRLADVQPIWEVRLRRAGNPNEISSDFEISEQSLPWTNREPSGRKIRPTKVTYGESSIHQSATQQTDSELSRLQEAAANERIILPTAWQCYLEYMDVVAERLSRKDQGVELKRLALEDARSRSEAPPPEFPEEIGTPAEFRSRLAGHEFEIRTKFNRREHAILIRVYQLPPDEYEDLDASGEPPGHWEGLMWVPDRRR
jgi:hypothetical protein